MTQHVDRPRGWPSECLRPPVHTRYVSMRWPQDCVRRRTGATRKSTGATLRVATAPREMTPGQTKSTKPNETPRGINAKTKEFMKSMTVFEKDIKLINSSILRTRGISGFHVFLYGFQAGFHWISWISFGLSSFHGARLRPARCRRPWRPMYSAALAVTQQAHASGAPHWKRRGGHNFGVNLSLTKSRKQDGLQEPRASTSSGPFVLHACHPLSTAIY